MTTTDGRQELRQAKEPWASLDSQVASHVKVGGLMFPAFIQPEWFRTQSGERGDGNSLQKSKRAVHGFIKYSRRIDPMSGCRAPIRLDRISDFQ